MSLPSTPPSPSPHSLTTPRNSKNGSFCTPLRPSRGRRSNVAPLTPQSLVASKTSHELKYYSNENSPHSSNQKSPANDPGWRIHEESLSPTNTHMDTHATEEQPSPLTTPTKLAGPFTPQVNKKSRSPLASDVFNLLSDNPSTRGSFTDPPPRRRETRPPLNEDDHLDADQMSTIQENMNVLESSLSTLFRSSEGTKCASCGAAERLSLLEPCRHHICASCVTGSLNVVGEKDMICMYCLSPIKSFKIARPMGRIHSGTMPQDSPFINHSHQVAFPQDSATVQELYDIASSLMDSHPPSALTTELPIVVLRIDNVPWDITPPMIEKWLGNPTLICHVLLDRVDGRTLNHAYVETTIEYARSALRTHQNKVLGHGRRARAATITLSSQEELMHALFPSWPGRFEGVLPVYETSPTDSQPPFPADMLTESELGIILHLVQSPRSHFLKLPCLAYWSLISILTKIPASDVFAPGTVPNTLFNIATFALEKYERLAGARGYDPVLHTKLINGAFQCKAFTERQLGNLLRFRNQPSPVMSASQTSNLGPPMRSSGNRLPLPLPPMVTMHSQRPNENFGLDYGPFVTLDACDRVAQDFGLDSLLVHALAERLVLHSSSDLPPFIH